MNRLTSRGNNMNASIANNDGSTPLQQAMKIPEVIERLAEIEDILGDDYDLDRLRELMNQRMSMREDVAERMKLVGSIPMERLREIVEADHEGRCVVFQKGYPVASQFYQDEDGLYIREATGVVSREEYEEALNGPVLHESNP